MTIKKLKPTGPNQRIVLLDILRGFALFGIFVVNIEIMNCVFINQESYGIQWTDRIDTLAVRVQQLFFYGKFFPIFSLLFGIGISIQMLRMHERGLPLRFFLRRMGMLFIFGAAHILLIWSGDVIHLYALLGLFTLALYKLKVRMLVLLATFLLVFPFYASIFDWILLRTGFDPLSPLASYTSDDIRNVIRHGSYYEGLVLRIREYQSNVAMLFLHLMPIAFSMFVLGLALGKSSVLQSIKQSALQIKKVAWLVFVITTLYRLFFLFFLWELPIWKEVFYRSIFIYCMQLSDTLLGLLYVWFLVRAYQNNRFAKLLNPLQYAGRMALTNYIFQSSIGFFIFSGYGLGWYEYRSPAQLILLAITVFICQVLISKWWLLRFRYGPLEWLWRCVSYWKWLPLRYDKKKGTL